MPVESSSEACARVGLAPEDDSLSMSARMRLAFLIPALLAGPFAAAPQAPAASGTIVRGVVFDSLEMRGLAGATVQITDATGKPWTRTVATDSSGRFVVEEVPIGTYLIGFFHMKLDSLAIATPTFRADVRTVQPLDVRLGVPSARTIARALCGRTAIADSTGLFMGYLRGAGNSMPRPNGTVVVRWSELIIEKGAIGRVVPSVEASSGQTGQVAVCGLPLGTPMVLAAASASDSSGSFELTIPHSGFLHRDIFVAPVVRRVVAGSDSSPSVELLRGTGRLRGRVVGANGGPLTGARVSLWGTGLETLTGADGAFQLSELPGGTHTLEVRAVGFAPVQRPVDIVEGDGDATEVALANLAIMLDTVRVSAERIYTSRREADFEQRLRTGVGHVIQAKDIAKRQATSLTEILRTVPGVLIVPSRFASEDVLMRGGEAILGPGTCRPDIYIDGSRVANDPTFPINSLVLVNEIRAVEVYSRPASVPTEYRSLSGCGAILLWTMGSR
jgi:carboxypeptidase family protein/TonB-dependent receptor-like protein